MTQDQYRTEFKRLRSRYPQFQMPETSFVEKIYFEELKYFSLEIIRDGIHDALRISPSYFPPLGVLISCCNAASISQSTDKPPWDHLQKFPPHPHQCGPAGSQTYNGIAYKMLRAIGGYEAHHIVCPGPFRPRCPMCGQDQPPFVNPFIRELMRVYPYQTDNWNHQHKGNLLCDLCAQTIRREWIPSVNVGTDEPAWRRRRTVAV